MVPAGPMVAGGSAAPLAELESELVGLAGSLAAGQCRFLLLLAEFDVRDGWAGPGLRSCAHWLSWRVGMDLRTAQEHLRVGRALVALPRLAEAFGAGRVSYSKIRALTRIATPETEDALLDLALAGTASHVERIVRLTRRAGADGTAAIARRSACWQWDEDGFLQLRARIPAEQGALVVAALDALTAPAPRSAERPDPARAAPDSGEPLPGPDWTPRQRDWITSGTEHAPGAVLDRVAARRADALVALAERALVEPSPRELSPAEGVPAEGLPADPFPADHVPVDSVPAEDEPSDRGLAASFSDGSESAATATTPGAATGPTAATGPGAAKASAAGAGDCAGPAVGARRVIGHELVVHLYADTGTAEIENGPALPATTVQRIACSAQVTALIEDRRGNPLYLGRRRRLASRAQLRALRSRDRHRCRFPGCSNTRYLDAHHIVSWLAGGPTDIDNLALLCDFHHHLVHDRGYLIRWDGDELEFRRPNGDLVPEVPVALSGRLADLVEFRAADGLRDDRDARITPSWAGERMDPDALLVRLLPAPPGPAAPFGRAQSEPAPTAA